MVRLKFFHPVRKNKVISNEPFELEHDGAVFPNQINTVAKTPKIKLESATTTLLTLVNTNKVKAAHILAHNCFFVLKQPLDLCFFLCNSIVSCSSGSRSTMSFGADCRFKNQNNKFKEV